MTEVKVIKERLKEVIKNKGKVILSGTHGSGKTTIVEKFAPYFRVAPEMIRQLETGENPIFRFKPSDTGNPWEDDQYCFSEIALLDLYTTMAFNMNIVLKEKPMLMDRNVFDPIFYIKMNSYMINFKHHVPASFGINPMVKTMRLHDYAKHMIIQTIQTGFYDNAIIFLPLPLPLDEKDEFRLKGEELQRTVFENAVSEYKSFEIPAHVLKADVISNMIEEALVELGIKK